MLNTQKSCEMNKQQAEGKMLLIACTNCGYIKDRTGALCLPLPLLLKVA